AAMGSKVLAIDLDPQAHLTIHLGLEPQTVQAGSYKVLTQSAGVGREILLTRLNLWLLPANINLVGAETELVSVVGRETILREALEEIEDKFDYCLIDCPPSLGLLTLNALAAAQEVLIPLQPHFLALQGFGKLLQTIELVNKRINPGLKVEGILLCMFDTRASLPSEVRADIEQFLSNARGTNCAWAQARILPTFIRRNIKLAEAPSYGKTIFEYEEDCHGAEDYRKVAEFIRSRSPAPTSAPKAHADKARPVPTMSIQAPPNVPEPQGPIRQPVRSGENQGPTPISPTTRPQTDSQTQPNPKPQPSLEPRSQPPVESSPVARGNVQPVPQPKRKLSSTYEYRPQAPVENRPIAPRNPQAPLPPNPQPVNSDQIRRNAPIEIRQIRQPDSQAPQQPNAQQLDTDKSGPVSRIRPIKPQDARMPNSGSERTTPTEPDQPK
nr:AAA family ATPase [Planctomycetota bacterium]